MDSFVYLGLIAGALTTISFLPQVIKSWRTKQTRDISLPMFTVLSIGLLLWLIYGILIRNLPVIFTNAITLVLAFSILIAKLKYK